MHDSPIVIQMTRNGGARLRSSPPPHSEPGVPALPCLGLAFMSDPVSVNVWRTTQLLPCGPQDLLLLLPLSHHASPWHLAA